MQPPQTSPERLAAALQAWRDLLGTSQVQADAAALARAATATFATTQRVRAVLQPLTRAQVAPLLRIATEHGVPVYPVSGGRNWGYGSRVPPQDGCALLDLARLDRVLDFDEKLAYVTVEPGVTFRALFAFLQARTTRLFMSVPGTSPDASVIGNALERGDGSGAYGDRFAHVCALEVVLPDGSCVHTGHARFPGARTAPLHRWGVGPTLDGLFTQSSLGVVTQMTLWLMPAPAHYQILAFAVGDDARLPDLCDGLQRLRLEGTVRSSISLWNDYKALSIHGRYPFTMTGGVTPLPAELLARLRAKGGMGRWMGSFPLYAASAAQGAADRERAREVLGGLVDALHVQEGLPDWSDRFARGPSLGAPHERNLPTMYWRKRRPGAAPLDPDRDGCGFLWSAPVVPFDGAQIAAVARTSEEALQRHGFEPQVAVLCLTERAVYVVASIIYDREVPGEDERARRCHDELFARLCQDGYYPCRLGLQSMDLLPQADDDSPRLLQALKQALDPMGVLAPGRYPR